MRQVVFCRWGLVARCFVGLLIIAVLMSIAAGGGGPFESLSGHLPRFASAAGPSANDFQLKDLNGSAVRLSDYKGRQSVLLYFWATWCSACKTVKPEISKLRSEIGRDKMEILAINVGHIDTLEKVMQYQKAQPIPCTVLYDDGGKVTDAYQVRGIPLFVLINKEGSVVYRSNSLPGNIQRYLDEKS
jgi:peroxiredoxin